MPLEKTTRGKCGILSLAIPFTWAAEGLSIPVCSRLGAKCIPSLIEAWSSVSAAFSFFQRQGGELSYLKGTTGIGETGRFGSHKNSQKRSGEASLKRVDELAEIRV